jgi:large subunit ribosomal protein L10
MPTTQKEQLVEKIKDRFAASQAILLVDYRGLSVKELEQLRNRLREAGA